MTTMSYEERRRLDERQAELDAMTRAHRGGISARDHLAAITAAPNQAHVKASATPTVLGAIADEVYVSRRAQVETIAAVGGTQPAAAGGLFGARRAQAIAARRAAEGTPAEVEGA